MKSNIFVFVIFLASCSIGAQITPKQAFIQMKRGINMGNTLEAPTEGSMAMAAQEYFFDDYKAAGFNTVRIPVRWYPYTQAQSPYEISETWMQRVEQVVDWALNRGLFVIMNLHHSSPIKDDYMGQKNRYDSIWRQISERFKDKSEKLFFEMMNEPHGWTVHQTNDFNQRILGIIRKTNPTRIVIYSGNGWSAANDLINSGLNIPNDDYIIGTYHCYDPWNFGGLGKATWGTQQDKDALENTFIHVTQWSKSKGIPVLLGEFGATNVINEGNATSDDNSRYRHYAANVYFTLKYNIRFTVWDDGGWFNVYQRGTREWNELKDILVHYSTHSPDDFKVELMPDSTMVLNWKNQIECDSIEIQRRTKNGTYQTIEYVDGAKEGYVDASYALKQTYYYRLITHESDTSSSFSYPQYINATPRVKQPYKNLIHKLPGIVEAEDFDEGGEGLSYHDVDLSNNGNVYRINDGVDIEKREDGGYHVGWTEPGEWLEYSVNITSDSVYNIKLKCAALESGARIRLHFGDISSNQIDIPSTNSWQTTTEVETAMNLKKGDHIFKIEIVKGGLNIDKIIIAEKTHIGISNHKYNSLKIFPNPTSDTFTIRFPENEYEADIIVYDLAGQSVKKNKVTYEQTISIEDLPKGCYVVEALMNNKVSYTNKLIVQ